MRLLATLLLVCTALLSAPTSWAQPEQEPTELEVLQHRMGVLRQETAQTGNRDTAAMEALLDEVDAYNNRFKMDPDGHLLAGRLQVMLGRVDQAHVLYRRALLREPHRIMDGLEWAAIHHESNPMKTISVLRELMAAAPERRAYPLALYDYLMDIDPSQVDREFDAYLMQDQFSVATGSLVEVVGRKQLDRGIEMGKRLLEKYPDSDEVKVAYIRRLRQAASFKEALQFMEERGSHLLLRPDVGIMYSDCLYADHQFYASIEHLIEMEENVDETYRNENRDRDSRLSLRPRILESWKREDQIRTSEKLADTNPRILMTIDGRPVLLELHEHSAPVTVANFLALVKDGHYGKSWFHNVVPAFMSQGGISIDDAYPSWHDPGYSIVNEAGLPEARAHFAGSIAMTTISPNKLIGSQFYITHTPTMHLDGQNPVFGRVMEGLDVIRSMRGGEKIDSIEIIREGTLERGFEVQLEDGSSMTYEGWKRSRPGDADQSAP